MCRGDRRGSQLAPSECGLKRQAATPEVVIRCHSSKIHTQQLQPQVLQLPMPQAWLVLHWPSLVQPIHSP